MLWMSQCSSWIQRVRRSGALTECGGGRVETTEQRWSLKVRYKRDVAEQALSLCYTAGSVTTDCSPAPLFSSPSVSLCSLLILIYYSVFPYITCFYLSLLSLPATCLSVYQFSFLSVSCFIAFLFLDCCRVNLLSICPTPLYASITNTGAETLNWGQWCTINFSNLTPPSFLPLMLLHLPCHVCTCMHVRIGVCVKDAESRWLCLTPK